MQTKTVDKRPLCVWQGAEGRGGAVVDVFGAINTDYPNKLSYRFPSYSSSMLTNKLQKKSEEFNLAVVHYFTMVELLNMLVNCGHVNILRFASMPWKLFKTQLR